MSVKIKQHDFRDCGAACLASVASHYKLKIPIARIRQCALESVFKVCTAC